jgi:hypothetical protein
MTRTIRKNSKEFTAAFANATNIRCYSLSNYFNGSTVAAICDYDRENCKLVHDGETYKARVHSNLWYEFNARTA